MFCHFHANQTHFDLYIKHFCTRTRFETEAQGKLNSLLALTILLRLHVPVLHFFWMQSCCYHSRRVAFLCCIWNRWEPQRKTCRLTSHMTWTRYILEQHNWGQAEPMARGVVPTVRHYRWTEEKIIWAKYQYSQLKLGL